MTWTAGLHVSMASGPECLPTSESLIHLAQDRAKVIFMLYVLFFK